MPSTVNIMKHSITVPDPPSRKGQDQINLALTTPTKLSLCGEAKNGTTNKLSFENGHSETPKSHHTTSLPDRPSPLSNHNDYVVCLGDNHHHHPSLDAISTGINDTTAIHNTTELLSSSKGNNRFVAFGSSPSPHHYDVSSNSSATKYAPSNVKMTSVLATSTLYSIAEGNKTDGSLDNISSSVAGTNFTSTNCSLNHFQFPGSSPSPSSTTSSRASPFSPGGTTSLLKSPIQNNLPNHQMPHSIPHKWSKKTRKLDFKNEMCIGCHRSLTLLSTNLQCKAKNCGQKVHEECIDKVKNNCGLTVEHFKFFWMKIHTDKGKEKWDSGKSSGGDSSSSTNSTAPSTPAANSLYSTVPKAINMMTSASYSSTSSAERFSFPESGNTTFSQATTTSLTSNNSSNNNNNNLPYIILTSSTNTDSVQGSKSQRNGVSSKIWPEPNTTTLDEEDLDATDIPISMPTNLSATNDSDTTLKSLVLEEKVSSKRLLFDGIELPEFEGIGCYRGKFHTTSMRIKYKKISSDNTGIKTNDEVDVKEFIGRGRFGEVRRGQFHEEIVIKFLNMDHVEEAGRGKALYNDTTSFRETRHPNIALFKGYMIDKNIYALIIQDCKDCSLHRLIHGDPSNDSRMKSNSLEYSQTLSFAQQICLGMQYLKARNIIHKDLRTKNIFVDGKKIIITDYGLFNMARLQYPKRNHGYLVSENWTTYLAPELIRSLNSTFSPLPFSYKTDIYSFGTCLYEMFFRKFPFENEAWERRIFFIGRGVKASFKGFNVNRVLTGIITKCWDINPEVRNEFEEIHKKLNDVPKKHVTRSPSFPSPKSYESIF